MTGTANNDTFTADNSGAAGTKQMSVADTIDGGAGIDTLKVYMNTADTSPGLGTLTSIETLYLNGGVVTAFTAPAGVTSLTIDAPVAAAATTVYTSTAVAVTVKGLDSVANAQITRLAGNTDTAVNLTLSAFTGTNNTVDLSGTLAATLNLTSTGAAANIATNLTNTGLKLATINIAGDKAFTATLNGAGYATTGIAVINAATDTAATTLTIAAAASATTGANLATAFAYTGGTAADTLNLTAAQVANVNVTAAQLNAMTFNGGTGIDTLILSNTVATGATALTSLTNIEVIGDTAATGTINMANFGTATGVKFTGDTTGAVTINNLASTATWDWGTATVGTAGFVNAISNGTTDALTWTLGSSTLALTGSAVGLETISGYETVNLTSQGVAAGTNTLAAVTIGASAGGAETLNITATIGLTTGALILSGSSTTVNVTGAGALITGAMTAGTFNDTGTGAITIATASNILSFNAGTNNAATSILDTNASSAALISTGNGANTITGGAFNDVITTGTGANTITGGAGADRITLGTHAGTTSTPNVIDNIVQIIGSSGTFAAPGANTINTSTFDVVTGLVKGDTIQLSTATYTAAAGAATGLVANGVAATTLVGLGGVDNTVYEVRGTYTAATNTFVGSGTGADTLIEYDASGVAATITLEAIVLVGYNGSGGITGIGGNTGLITLA